MARRLTAIEKKERTDFILQRLKRGFSFVETQRQYAERFQVHIDTARKSVHKACAQLSEQEGLESRLRAYSVCVEMLHDQITSYQGELLAIAKEIKDLEDLADQRTALTEQLMTAQDPFTIKQLLSQLEQLPQVSPGLKITLIEAKTRVRDRMNRVISDLIRLRGFNQTSESMRITVEGELLATLRALQLRMGPEEYTALLGHITALRSEDES